MSLKTINISKYLDSTFLKTSEELKISDEELKEKITLFINEAIDCNFKCVMLRPNFVSLACSLKNERNSNINVGTVIDFPFGNSNLENKLEEAKLALLNGANELDFVCDYNLFKMGEYDTFDKSILECTQLALKNKAIVKWIIETGALSKNEIKLIAKRIFDTVIRNFPNEVSEVFVKTSTGYYGGFGATIKDIKSIKSVISDMPVKASGGVSDLTSCLNMIEAGADRIGTSKAFIIYNEWKKEN